MSTKDLKPQVPSPDAQELQHSYGEFASEYARVRADAAQRAGDPERHAWERVEDQLEQGAVREER